MRTRIGSLAAGLLIVLVVTPAAMGAQSFRPRIGGAMGIMPPAGSHDIAIGSNLPVVYHGGAVMRAPVRIHSIFWAPRGFAFDGSPTPGILGYEPMIQQFFANAAHDSGAADNVFSVLGQYPDLGGANRYRFAYDSVDATDPYPPRSRQCASDDQIATCVTDTEIGAELSRVIRSHDPAGHGLHDVWLVFLPPNVDECYAPGACGSDSFSGYHSVSDLGGEVVYAVIIDPLIELVTPPGSDPQGNPNAESSIDTAAHETVEAITNPDGVGWMDPNGFEVADKCENGPQVGTPLGYAANGSPYDQVIGGDTYLIQSMWSNSAAGCVQSSAVMTSPLPLASVSIKQFSQSISGSTGRPAAGTSVRVALVRAGSVVASAQSRTRPGGRWGPVRLRSLSRATVGSAHGFGDDRDVIKIRYGSGGPRSDQIETGNGGDPFSESGWTSWLDLDTGYRVAHNSILLAPCSQTGVLRLDVGGLPTASPLPLCNTGTATASVPTRPLGPGTQLSLSSTDNRAPGLSNRNGALVNLTTALGEPGSVSALGNDRVLFDPSGFPSCLADLRAQSVRCTGLVPFAGYSLERRRGHGRAIARAQADGGGVVTVAGLPGPVRIARGDRLTLVNRAGRILTTLHVAHLRVDITGAQTVVAAGSCEPGDYYGPPLLRPPSSPGVGFPGASGTGTICPLSGHAAGLADAHIAQTDDLSGGQTRTEVPMLVGTAPTQDATLYGRFTALAQTGLTGANGSTFAAGARVALTITRAGSKRSVFHATNVDTARGAPVRGLVHGVYQARWQVIDANGDTRTVSTRFVVVG